VSHFDEDFLVEQRAFLASFSDATSNTTTVTLTDTPSKKRQKSVGFIEWQKDFLAENVTRQLESEIMERAVQVVHETIKARKDKIRKYLVADGVRWAQAALERDRDATNASPVVECEVKPDTNLFKRSDENRQTDVRKRHRVEEVTDAMLEHFNSEKERLRTEPSLSDAPEILFRDVRVEEASVTDDGLLTFMQTNNAFHTKLEELNKAFRQWRKLHGCERKPPAGS
jgi:phenylpyruvate tautomerase PptA (4-oxalocrotonate tautomerase family)